MKPAFIFKLRELIRNFSLFISAFAKNILCMRGGSRIAGLVLVSQDSNIYTDYGHTKAKFQIQIPIPKQYLGLVFCRNHCTKMGADSVVKKSQNAPEFI